MILSYALLDEHCKLTAIDIERREDAIGVIIQHGQLFGFLRGGREHVLLDLFAHLANFGLQAFAHRRFEGFIRLEGCFGGIAQHVELTHLVRHIWPEFLDG